MLHSVFYSFKGSVLQTCYWQDLKWWRKFPEIVHSASEVLIFLSEFTYLFTFYRGGIFHYYIYLPCLFSTEVKYSIEAEEERLNLGFTSRVFFENSDPDHAIRDQTINLRPQSDEAPKRSGMFYVILKVRFNLELYHVHVCF